MGTDTPATASPTSEHLLTPPVLPRLASTNVENQIFPAMVTSVHVSPTVCNDSLQKMYTVIISWLIQVDIRQQGLTHC